jgi:hypothetical protein
VTGIIKDTLKKHLTGKKYDAELAGEYIMNISNDILAEIKSKTNLITI